MMDSNLFDLGVGLGEALHIYPPQLSTAVSRHMAFYVIKTINLFVKNVLKYLFVLGFIALSKSSLHFFHENNKQRHMQQLLLQTNAAVHHFAAL